jgi:hypothetical protein
MFTLCTRQSCLESTVKVHKAAAPNGKYNDDLSYAPLRFSCKMMLQVGEWSPAAGLSISGHPEENSNDQETWESQYHPHAMKS